MVRPHPEALRKLHDEMRGQCWSRAIGLIWFSKILLRMLGTNRFTGFPAVEALRRVTPVTASTRAGKVAPLPGYVSNFVPRANAGIPAISGRSPRDGGDTVGRMRAKPFRDIHRLIEPAGPGSLVDMRGDAAVL
jgi:hypothetical protein